MVVLANVHYDWNRHIWDIRESPVQLLRWLKPFLECVLTIVSVGQGAIGQHHRLRRETHIHPRGHVHSPVANMLLLSTHQRQRHHVVQLGATCECGVDFICLPRLHRVDSMAVQVRHLCKSWPLLADLI